MGGSIICVLHKYNENDQVEDDEIGRACIMTGGRRSMHIGY
jgi:hypothetical protein